MSNRIYSDNEAAQKILDNLELEANDDGNGQIVIYTGLFRWADGTIHDEPEPKSDDKLWSGMDKKEAEELTKLLAG